MRRESVTCEAEALGLVFPVYHKSMPLILERFVEKLAGLAGRYVFAVSTHGDTPGWISITSRTLSRCEAASWRPDWASTCPTTTSLSFLGSRQLMDRAFRASRGRSVQRLWGLRPDLPGAQR